MVKICPVSDRIVNENVSRFNALYTLLFVLGFIFTGNIGFLLILILDFSLRLILKGSFSPVIRLNQFLLEKMNIRKTMINAGPKIFAARIGITLSILGLIFMIPGYKQVSTVTIGILGFFSFLEFAFGLCVACKIYPYALHLNNIRFPFRF